MPVVHADGLSWLVDEAGVDGQLGPDNHEESLAGWFACDGVFLDVGADVGRWSLRCADRCEHVYAVEPYTPRRERIRANCALNGIANVTLLACGAWDDWSAATLGRTGHVGDAGDVVPLAPLDDVLDPLRLDLVKIDVEGHEARAIAGMAGMLMRHKPRIILELHDRLYGEQVKTDTFAILDKLGYLPRKVDQLGGQDYYVCEVR